MSIETIVISIATFSGAVVMLFVREFVSAIWKDMNIKTDKPAAFIKKAANVFLKGFLPILLSYILPIGSIIFLMISSYPANKIFILLLTANMMALFSNIVIVIFRKIERMRKDNIQYVEGLVGNMRQNTSNMNQVIDILKQHQEAINNIQNRIG